MDFGPENPHAAECIKWACISLRHELQVLMEVAPSRVPTELRTSEQVDTWLSDLAAHFARSGGGTVYGIVVGRKPERERA